MRTYFDHENLDVYQLELRFVTWVTGLLAKMKQHPTSARIAEDSDQLDRASLSSLLKTAERNGRRRRQTRAKFFDDARGSVTECAACLDALVAKRELHARKDRRWQTAFAADCFDAYEADYALRFLLGGPRSGTGKRNRARGRGGGGERERERE